MAKFCETLFAQSELMVYKSEMMERNYKTYRTTWSFDAVAVEQELDAATIAIIVAAATATQATESEAKEATTIALVVAAKAKQHRLLQHQRQ
jgi:hypothetical protein